MPEKNEKILKPEYRRVGKFDRETVEALADDGIDSVIIEDEVISCTSDEVVFTDIHEGYDVVGK